MVSDATLFSKIWGAPEAAQDKTYLVSESMTYAG